MVRNRQISPYVGVKVRQKYAMGSTPRAPVFLMGEEVAVYYSSNSFFGDGQGSGKSFEKTNILGRGESIK